MSKPHDPAPTSAPADLGRPELPSLTALLAFDAALRHRSFTRAGRELGRTQGAVSRQIALLEEQLGRPLFHREHPHLRPTRAARTFGVKLHRVLDRLSAIVLETQAGDDEGGVLNLAVLPTFGTTWLIPRLAGFLADHPAVSVHLTTSLQIFDFEAEELDVAIHYGEGVWPRARSEALMEEEVVVVCAPSLIQKRALAEPADLAGQTLLQLSSRPAGWDSWLAQNELGGIAGRRGPRFEHHLMVLQAAQAGLGVALLPDFVAAEPLERGSLVEPFPGRRARTHRSYWLVYPERSLELPALHSFRAWLRTEIESARRPTDAQTRAVSSSDR